MSYDVLVNGNPMFEQCPMEDECGRAIRVTLAVDWRDRVAAGDAIPVIGCGNPWHYVAPNARLELDAAAEANR